MIILIKLYIKFYVKSIAIFLVLIYRSILALNLIIILKDFFKQALSPNVTGICDVPVPLGLAKNLLH